MITLGGPLASVAVVGLNFAIESATQLDFLSISVWFVIPAGEAIAAQPDIMSYARSMAGTDLRWTCIFTRDAPLHHTICEA